MNVFHKTVSILTSMTDRPSSMSLSSSRETAVAAAVTPIRTHPTLAQAPPPLVRKQRPSGDSNDGGETRVSATRFLSLPEEKSQQDGQVPSQEQQHHKNRIRRLFMVDNYTEIGTLPRLHTIQQQNIRPLERKLGPELTALFGTSQLSSIDHSPSQVPSPLHKRTSSSSSTPPPSRLSSEQQQINIHSDRHLSQSSMSPPLSLSPEYNIDGDTLDERDIFPSQVLNIKAKPSMHTVQQQQPPQLQLHESSGFLGGKAPLDECILKIETDSMLKLMSDELTTSCKVLASVAKRIFAPVGLKDIQALIPSWPDCLVPISMYVVDKDRFLAVNDSVVGGRSKILNTDDLKYMDNIITRCQLPEYRDIVDGGKMQVRSFSIPQDKQIWQAAMQMAAIVTERYADDCGHIFPENYCLYMKYIGPVWQDWIDALVSGVVSGGMVIGNSESKFCGFYGNYEVQIMTQAAVNVLGKLPVILHLASRAFQQRYNWKLTKCPREFQHKGPESIRNKLIQNCFWRMAQNLILLDRVYDTRPVSSLFDNPPGLFKLISCHGPLSVSSATGTRSLAATTVANPLAATPSIVKHISIKSSSNNKKNNPVTLRRVGSSDSHASAYAAPHISQEMDIDQFSESSPLDYTQTDQF